MIEKIRMGMSHHRKGVLVGVMLLATLLLSMGLVYASESIGLGDSDVDGVVSKKLDVEYDSSTLYDKADMDAAITVLKSDFTKFNGAVLTDVKYYGDTASAADMLKSINTFVPKGSAPYKQCMAFEVKLHANEDLPSMFIEKGNDYTLEWLMVQNADGSWKTWGHEEKGVTSMLTDMAQ